MFYYKRTEYLDSTPTHANLEYLDSRRAHENVEFLDNKRTHKNVGLWKERPWLPSKSMGTLDIF